MRFILLLWSLVDCFLGYPAFRILLALHGVAAGIAGGGFLVSHLRDQPAAADYVVACVALGILSGLLAWFCYRLALATGAALLAAVVGAWVLGNTPGAWAIGVALGVGIGALAYAYARRMIVIISSVAGGFGAIYHLAAMILSPEADILARIPRDIVLAVSLIVPATALSLAGAYVQVRLARTFGALLMPRRRSGASRPVEVLPKFTRV